MTDITELEEAPAINNWEFLNVPPTRQQTLELLETLDDCWGVPMRSVADFVQALPQRKKVKRPHPTNPQVMVDENVTSYSLYVSVAGRLHLANLIAQKNNWCIEFQPEPVTPTGIPGFLQFDDKRIVLREYVVIYRLDADGDPEKMLPLGRKAGTAWVPARDGKNAAGTNPFEKVETSARGRALAAWGIGVLPGSGVASLEEIEMANQNRQALRTGGAASQPHRRSRDELIAAAQRCVEEIRQARDHDVEEQNDIVAKRLAEIGARFERAEGAPIPWDKLSDGHLQLIANDLQASVDRIRSAVNTQGME